MSEHRNRYKSATSGRCLPALLPLLDQVADDAGDLGHGRDVVPPWEAPNHLGLHLVRRVLLPAFGLTADTNS